MVNNIKIAVSNLGDFGVRKNEDFVNGELRIENGEWKMKENVIKTKTYDFSLRIIRLFQYLGENKEYVLSKQVLRSGTSIGAMVEEAEQAESKPDFIHKMGIANKEANETHYWIRLLRDSNYIKENDAESVLNDCDEIKKIIASIIKTSKEKLK